MRQRKTCQFAGWWVNPDLLRTRHHERIIPSPNDYAGSAVIDKGYGRIWYWRRGEDARIDLSADPRLKITHLDRTAFVVTFPDHRTILFSLPWDQRHPIKFFLDKHFNFKRRILDILNERSIKKAMEEWERTRTDQPSS